MENTLAVFYFLLAIWLLVSIYETFSLYRFYKHEVKEPFELIHFVGMRTIEMSKSFVMVVVITAIFGLGSILLELIAEKLRS